MIMNPKKRYQILDQLHGTRSRFKIIGIGAGASGLYLAYSCNKRMQDYDLTIYEKNGDIGGTWLESMQSSQRISDKKKDPC